jgi:hypothetical protein
LRIAFISLRIAPIISLNDIFSDIFKQLLFQKLDCPQNRVMQSDSRVRAIKIFILSLRWNLF